MWKLSPLLAVLLCAASAAHAESPWDIQVGLGTASTLVYRGIPQYASEDTPSFQMDSALSYQHSPQVASFFQAFGATTFYERSRNARLGSSDYIDLAGGLALRLSETWQLDAGAAVDLRPNSDTVDERKEVLLRTGWTMYEDPVLRLTQSLEVRGEVHRHLGAYGLLIFRAERQMGNGFVFAGQLDGGWSYYSRGTDEFQFGAVKGEIVFHTPLPHVSVTAQISGSLARPTIDSEMTFTGRHGIVWSSIFVRYDAF